jgi:hypothetical protein
MIRLYYSGSEKAYEQQANATKSLGGFISNSLIGNSVLNSIFSNLFASKDNRNETKLIVLKNEGAAITTPLKIWIDHTQLVYSEILISGVLPYTDSCSNLKFENIPSADSLPTYAEFEKFDSDTNFLEIDSFANNSYIGIWLQRKVLSSKIVELDNLISCDSLIDGDIDLSQILENFSLKIEY